MLIIFILAILLTALSLVIIFSIKTLNDQPVLLLDNYNTRGGFFWQMYNVLQMLRLAENLKMRPVVIFSKGLYLEDRVQFIRNIPTYDRNNWFNNYFQPIGFSKNINLCCSIENLPALQKHNINKYKIFQFNRETLDSFKHNSNTSTFFKLWYKYVVLQPHIKLELKKLKQKFFKNKKYKIGLHYRGTDKYPSKTAHEDFPIHYEYDFCKDLLLEEIEKAIKTERNKAKIVIFVATDEKPFVDFLGNKLNDVDICYTNSIRSNLSTSGLLLDTTKCRRGKYDSFVCTQYNKFINQSVHQGMHDKNRYKKGKDVLLDVLLLSECNIFLRSRGNVSNFVTFLSRKQTVIDLVHVYTLKKKKVEK